jgi:glucose-6-phosphate dehydrogenase assembly protein OpcA
MQMIDDELFGTETSPEGSEGINTLKTSLFTLIIAVKDIDRTMHCQRLVHLIAEKLPCKVIFVSIDSNAQESFLRQNLSTRRVTNGHSICCDVLTIQTSLDQLHKVSFLITPQTIPDLPVFLLVGHDPSEVQLLVDDLQTLVGRIVFDAARISNIGAFAERIIGFAYKQKYVDLNWARTKPWRETFARVFNNKERLESLARCSSVEIRFSQSPTCTNHPDTQALFFQSWLASRLKWQPSSIEESADSFKIQYTFDQRPISVIIIPTDSEVMDEGGITSIEIRGENDLHYLMSYEQDDRHIGVHASSKDRCEMPYTLFVGSFQRGRALPSEIFQQASSEHYLPMIELLSGPLWHRERTSK